ncbi:MAG: enoyl-CoA hydratase-related protein [bacterium]
MSHLLCEEEGGVATLTLNRPEMKNPVDEEIMRGLSGHIDRLAGEADLRAVILTGAGGEAFCAGGDLKWLQSFDTGEKGEAMSRRMQDILSRLSRLPVPVIAVLNGYALGGGTEIALACDMRVMEAHAYLHFKQARVGLITAWGGAARLVRLAGYGRAMELLTACRKLESAEALRIGVANAVVPRGEGLAEGRRLAAEIVEGAPMSIRLIKRLLLAARELSGEAADKLEAALFREAWTSADHDEAVRAFLEKRAPEFRGE